MKKRIFTMIALATIMFIISVQAVEPRVINSKPSLTFIGTTAHCFVSCIGENDNDDIEVTLTLYQGTTYVDSWSKSGKGQVTLSGDSKAKSRKSYKLVLTYSVNGESQPSVSTTKTCP